MVKAVDRALVVEEAIIELVARLVASQTQREVYEAA